VIEFISGSLKRISLVAKLEQSILFETSLRKQLKKLFLRL